MSGGGNVRGIMYEEGNVQGHVLYSQEQVYKGGEFDTVDQC